jgi:hypothetical protein
MFFIFIYLFIYYGSERHQHATSASRLFRHCRRKAVPAFFFSRAFLTAHIHTCIHTYMHAHIHTCARIHTYIHTNTRTYIHTCTHTRIHNMHAGTHAYIHTYIHTHTHACNGRSYGHAMPCMYTVYGAAGFMDVHAG